VVGGRDHRTGPDLTRAPLTDQSTAVSTVVERIDQETMSFLADMTFSVRLVRLPLMKQHLVDYYNAIIYVHIRNFVVLPLEEHTLDKQGEPIATKEGDIRTFSVRENYIKIISIPLKEIFRDRVHSFWYLVGT